MLTDTGPDRLGTADELNAAVALHCRALRQSRGWSLDELAGRSGVSKGMLVQIEAARTNPSVGTLARVADAFGVTVSRLLEPVQDRTVHLSDAEEAPILWRGGRGGTARLLRGLNEPDIVELWEWRLAPHEEHISDDHQPGTREVLHVLSGMIIVTVADDEYTLGPGQTIDYLADRDHSYRNDFDTSARFLMLVCMPPRARPPRR